MKALFVLLAAATAAAQVQDFGGLRVKPLMHATALVEGGGQAVYVDPWKQANFTGLPKADFILVTDVHGDHFDRDAIGQIRQAGTQIIAPEAVAKDLPGARVLGNGESVALGSWTFEAVPMYNLQRGPAPGKFYHDKGRGNGYVITFGGKRLYFSGDTEGVPEMRALKNIDAAFICMNLPYTMTPEEAAEAVRAMRPKVAIPYHYRNSDTLLFQKALAGSGVEVRLLNWYPQ